jgi:hypothetical protein
MATPEFRLRLLDLMTMRLDEIGFHDAIARFARLCELHAL